MKSWSPFSGFRIQEVGGRNEETGVTSRHGRGAKGKSKHAENIYSSRTRSTISKTTRVISGLKSTG